MQHLQECLEKNKLPDALGVYFMISLISAVDWFFPIFVIYNVVCISIFLSIANHSESGGKI